MKACPKCKRQNASDCWLCECGYEFDGTEAVIPHGNSKPGSLNLKRFFVTLALVLAGSAAIFYGENRFLFGIHKIHPGMPNRVVKNILGEPFSVCWPADSQERPKKRDDIFQLRDTSWVYTIDFCGLLIGTYQIEYRDAKVFSVTRYLKFLSNPKAEVIRPSSHRI